ncbi:globin [Subtercola boreus]|uniref:Globin n=1 Tax=Subtercola boreus TaxID=120213 RepID=A0A3E0WC36_9MICO|nr:globin [Subtercola boreus]RFA22106.1 globin [Subtercola boreus]RFA22286.1 globin [Subtercola boreus]RFA28149.1 globin [Subtercola boreus]
MSDPAGSSPLSTPAPVPSSGAGRALPLIPLVPTASAPATDAGATFYEQIGGRPTFEKLVRTFYSGVAADPVLVAMYPEEDLEGAIQRLTGFLEQYWGGPTTYSQERGHPRLRMRHNPFKVNPDARDRWLTHMRAAVDSLQLAPLQDATLWDYLERAAHAMVNTFEE